MQWNYNNHIDEIYAIEKKKSQDEMTSFAYLLKLSLYNMPMIKFCFPPHFPLPSAFQVNFLDFVEMLGMIIVSFFFERIKFKYKIKFTHRKKNDTDKAFFIIGIKKSQYAGGKM